MRSLRSLQKLRSHSWDFDELQAKLGRSFLEEGDLLEAVPVFVNITLISFRGQLAFSSAYQPPSVSRAYKARCTVNGPCAQRDLR